MTHLRKMMLEELQRRNYAQSTVVAYIRALRDFVWLSMCAKARAVATATFHSARSCWRRCASIGAGQAENLLVPRPIERRPAPHSESGVVCL